MFRIEVFVDDKKLSYVLWALSGHCIEVKPPQPVMNASAKNGKVRADATGDKAELMVAHFRKDKMLTFRARDAKEWCVSAGLSSKSYSNVLYKAIAAKTIKRTKGKGTANYVYTIQKGA